MPPRILKRGAAAMGKRSAGRPSKKAMEEAAQPQQVKEKEEEEEEKPAVVMVDINEPAACSDGDGNGNGNKVVNEKKENEVHDSVDEYGKDERLDLDDHEPDYEHEEYCQVDYDEKNIEREDTQGVGDERGEENEESSGEEEHDMHDEQLEGFHEVEDEEDEDDACEEQERERLVDAEEEEEHHEVFKERRKRKEYEVFVGGLDKDATEDDLRKVFSQVGEVIEVRLMMNPQTKKNKGFAFLRFATIEQAKRAVAELKHPVINGKRCGVTPSQDSDTLFLGNICKTWTKEFLKEKLKRYGIDNVEDLTLVEDSNNVGMNRGFAFLEFSSRSDAMIAFRRLQKRDVVFGVDRPARVSFADSFVDPGDEIMAQVKTIFVDGLPPSWDEDRLRELLKEYGKVEKVELARNMPAAKRKDFGFVTFETHGAAVMCAKSINNSELGEPDDKAKVRARLSRPLQKGKGKYVNRIDFKGDFRSARGTGRVVRGDWGRPAPRTLPARGERGIRSRIPPVSLKRPVEYRERRPHVSIPARVRPVAPMSRSYERRPPPRVPSYPKSSLKREYDQWDEIPPPRSRVVSDYGSRVLPERHSSYRDDYPSHRSGYSDLPRSSSRPSARRPYVDDGYGRYDRPPPSYREEYARDYVPISGTKRPYSAIDHVPSGYADPDVRQSRTRVDYEYGGPAPQYEDAYEDRPGRSTVGYSGSRSSLSSQDLRGLYGSRHDMGYGGSYGGTDSGGMYSSSYGGDYMSRRSDAGGSSYSTYPGRSAGSSSYMGSGGSGSYY